MKHKLSAVLMFTLVQLSCFAQIPNPSFELLDSTNTLKNWRYTGIIAITLGDSIVYDGPLVSQSTSARTGSFALELRNSYNFTTGNPFMNGTASAVLPSNNTYQGFTDLIPMSGNPIGLDFYYKFSQNPLNDSLICTVKLFNSLDYEIASGEGKVWGQQSTYALKTVTLNYLSSIPPGNGNLIPVATSIEFKNKMSAGAPHIGQRTLIDDVSFRYSTVGIAENTSNADLKVFPNPVQALINIQSAHAFEAELINAVGQSVLKTQVSPIDVQSLNAGIYYLKIKRGDQLEVVKIVKY